MQNLSPKEAEEKIKAGDISIIDVRTPEEYSGGHIAGSFNINISSPTFAEEIMKLDKDKGYLTQCLSGGRSSKAQKMMVDLGFKNVYNLAGGITAWMKDQLPTTQG